MSAEEKKPEGEKAAGLPKLWWIIIAIVIIAIVIGVVAWVVTKPEEVLSPGKQRYTIIPITKTKTETITGFTGANQVTYRTIRVPKYADEAKISLIPGEDESGRIWGDQGPGDELGALNEITPKKVLEAVKLVKIGKIYDLGQVYESGIPAYPPRSWKTWLLAHESVKPSGKNKFTALEEYVCASMGMGTQLDGLGHVGIDKVHYNGVPLEDILDPKGAKKFGMEKVPPIVTRGVMLDMVAYKGRFLRGGEAITPADIEGCIEMEDVEIRPGDVVIFNTGWMRLWMKDNEKFLESEPGITVSTARYLAEKHVVAVGTDQWCTEVVPMEDPETLYPVHQELLAKNGIYLMQNLVTEKLAQDKVYEFFFVFTHPKIKGTVQGIGQPIAII